MSFGNRQEPSLLCPPRSPNSDHSATLPTCGGCGWAPVRSTPWPAHRCTPGVCLAHTRHEGRRTWTLSSVPWVQDGAPAGGGGGTPASGIKTLSLNTRLCSAVGEPWLGLWGWSSPGPWTVTSQSKDWSLKPGGRWGKGRAQQEGELGPQGAPRSKLPQPHTALGAHVLRCLGGCTLEDVGDQLGPYKGPWVLPAAFGCKNVLHLSPQEIPGTWLGHLGFAGRW